MRSKVLRIGDFIIITLVLLLAGVVAAPFVLAPSNALYCEIHRDGALVQRIRLAEGYTNVIRVEGEHGYDLVQIDSKRVAIIDADCPDQVCVQTGWLTRAGQSAVCLPNRVIVKLTGTADTNEVDAIVGSVG